MQPYPISYRSIVPKAAECENLLVPVCLSAIHIAYGSIRMEPVFMVLGQSAATAACIALDQSIAIQGVPSPKPCAPGCWRTNRSWSGIPDRFELYFSIRSGYFPEMNQFLRAWLLLESFGEHFRLCQSSRPEQLEKLPAPVTHGSSLDRS